jgi:hypothetical protein
MTRYYVITDINSQDDKAIWTLTGEQLNEIVKLMMAKGSDDLSSLGDCIGRSVRANSVKVGA